MQIYLIFSVCEILWYGLIVFVIITSILGLNLLFLGLINLFSIFVPLKLGLNYEPD